MKSPNFASTRGERALERVGVELAQRVEVQPVEPVEIRAGERCARVVPSREHGRHGS